LTQIDNLKHSIETILRLLPEKIVKYSLDDQKLIIDFIEVIKNFEEADNNRDSLIERFSIYSTSTRRKKEFLETPFLGLTIIFAENAIYNLSIARFHSLEFYRSLLQQLRPLFHLFNKQQPLNSEKFEEILDKIKIMHSPLNDNEIHFLNQTHSILKAGGLESLNSNQINEEIGNNETILKQLRKKTEISRVFTLVEGRWWIHFHSQAFGLSRVVFQFTRDEKTPLKEIIDLNDQKNTVLCNSDVYQIRGSSTEYIGIFLVPSKDVKLLKAFFQRCKEKGKIISKKLTNIDFRQRNTSLESYKEGFGWKDLSRGKKERIEKQIAPSNYNKWFMKNKYTTKSLQGNPQWHYSDQQNSEQIIRLYCKSPTEFSFTNLPLNIRTEKKPSMFSRKDIELLRHFYDESVINIGFIPWRLIDDYSTTTYFLEVTNIPISKLKRFLNIIPFAEVYFSSIGSFIWAVLSPKMVTWIKTSLGINVIPIQRCHVFKDLKFEWFNIGNNEWRTPNLLLSSDI